MSHRATPSRSLVLRPNPEMNEDRSLGSKYIEKKCFSKIWEKITFSLLQQMDINFFSILQHKRVDPWNPEKQKINLVSSSILKFCFQHAERSSTLLYNTFQSLFQFFNLWKSFYGIIVEIYQFCYFRSMGPGNCKTTRWLILWSAKMIGKRIELSLPKPCSLCCFTRSLDNFKGEGNSDASGR